MRVFPHWTRTLGDMLNGGCKVRVICVYQFCGENHLHRYLAEFEFRYNNRVAHGVNDTERADRLLVSVAGKRLKYA